MIWHTDLLCVVRTAVTAGQRILSSDPDLHSVHLRRIHCCPNCPLAALTLVTMIGLCAPARRKYRALAGRQDDLVSKRQSRNADNGTPAGRTARLSPRAHKRCAGSHSGCIQAQAPAPARHGHGSHILAGGAWTLTFASISILIPPAASGCIAGLDHGLGQNGPVGGCGIPPGQLAAGQLPEISCLGALHHTDAPTGPMQARRLPHERGGFARFCAASIDLPQLSLSLVDSWGISHKAQCPRSFKLDRCMPSILTRAIRA